MAESKKHRQTAERMARKFGGKYNKGKGPDVILSNQVIEVETSGTIEDAKRQLSGFKKPVYVVATDATAQKKAVESMNGTTIGVRDFRTGKIIKKSTRKKR